MKYLTILFCLCASSANAEWTSGDTKRQLAFTTLLVMDWSQTRYGTKHVRTAEDCDDFEEKNPILGKKPSPERIDTYFLSAAIIHAGISYALPDKYRAAWQYVSLGLEANSVIQNYRIGIGFDF